MDGGLRTRVIRVEPARVQLTVDGWARVRVLGRAFGWLRCGNETRWVWGAFAESFRVRRVTAVLVYGLGGIVRVPIPWEPSVDLQVPPFPLRSRAQRAANGAQASHEIWGAPRLARNLAPRLRTLRHEDLLRSSLPLPLGDGPGEGLRADEEHLHE